MLTIEVARRERCEEGRQDKATPCIPEICQASGILGAGSPRKLPMQPLFALLGVQSKIVCTQSKWLHSLNVSIYKSVPCLLADAADI